MKLKKITKVEVPIGMYVVDFDILWSNTCNPDQCRDCGECNAYVSEVEYTVTRITKNNWETLAVDNMDLESNTDDTHGDMHDLRRRIFKTRKKALEHAKFTVNRFNNPQPWESFVRL